jgi:DNA-binding XRE family transcriptional regulator
MVHPNNVERIKRFVAALEPDEGESIAAEMFFAKHFSGQSERAVILRGARHRENLTQAQLAELTGIPQRHISEMETGKRSIGKQRAKLIAKVLNIDYRLFL